MAATPLPPPSWPMAAARLKRRWAWSHCSSPPTLPTPACTPRTACSAFGAGTRAACSACVPCLVQGAVDGLLLRGAAKFVPCSQSCWPANPAPRTASPPSMPGTPGPLAGMTERTWCWRQRWSWTAPRCPARPTCCSSSCWPSSRRSWRSTSGSWSGRRGGRHARCGGWSARCSSSSASWRGASPNLWHASVAAAAARWCQARRWR